MNEFITLLNAGGRTCVGLGLPILIQSSILIVAVLALDLLLRRRLKAVVRYWIWLLVLVKLVLPPSLAAPTSLVSWIGARLPSLSSPAQTVVTEPQPAPIVVDLSEPPVVMPEPRFVPSTQEPAPAFETPAPTQTVAPQPVVAAAPAPPITWQAMVFLAWLLVVSVMTVLLIQRAFFVKGLVAQSDKASAPLADLLEQCRQQMKVGRGITLRLTSLSTSPSVCGLWRPRILMPRRMVARLETRQLRSILLHELAHVKRGDLWINLVQALLQIAYFFHPLLWLANLMIRRVREQAVDETVLAAMGNEAEDYPRTLLNISKLAFGRPALSLRLIGVVESKRALTARIKHIVSRPFPKSARLGLSGLVLLLTVAAVLLPMAKAQKNENTPDYTETEISAGLASFQIDPKAGRTLKISYWNEGLDLDSASEMLVETGWPAGMDINCTTELKAGKRTEDFVTVCLGDGNIDDVDGRRILTLKSDDVGTAAAELVERFDEFLSSKAVMNGFNTNRLPTFFAVLSDGVVFPATRLGAGVGSRETGQQLWLIRMTKADAEEVEIEGWQGRPPGNATDSIARKVTGQVVDPNGLPVRGAQVALGTDDKAVTILTPRLLPMDYANKTSDIVETDAKGRFTFADVPEDFVIVASHESGFAEIDGIDFTASAPIRLERWGQIEGTLYAGRLPAAPLEPLTLGLGTRRHYAAFVQYEHRAETKTDGRFVFRRVRPGWLTIGRESSSRTLAYGSVSQRPIYVEPGETLKITLGNAGQPLVGSFILPPDSNRPTDVAWGPCTLETVRPEIPHPAGFDQMTGIEKGQWYHQWYKTPEGRAYRERTYHDPDRRRYIFQPNDDNTFRIDNVIPGRYRFMAPLQKGPIWLPPFSKTVDHYFATIDVPPTAEPDSDRPLDLGCVTLTTDSDTAAPPNGPQDVIAGIVVGPDGNPIENADVTIGNKALLLVPESEHPPTDIMKQPVIQKPSAFTDAQGRFQFSKLRPGTTDITVSAKSCQTETLRDVSPGTTNLRVQLRRPQPPRPYMLSGIVRDEKGNPVSDAEVILARETRTVRENWTGTSSSVHTRADGTFQFPGLLDPVPDNAGHRELFVRKEGYGLWNKLHLSRGSETFTQVALRREETVSGRVIDKEGKPVSDATVAMRSWNNRDKMRSVSLHDWMPFVPRTATAPDGTFTLTGLPTDSTVYLGVAAEGYAAPQTQGIQAGQFGSYAIQMEDGGIMTVGSQQGTETPVEFVVQRAVTLRGVVVYEGSNEPAADIRVGAQGWQYVWQWKTGTRADRRFDPRACLAWSETRTDANGRFEMTDVRPSVCDLVVVPDVSPREAMPDWVARAITLEDLEPGETREDLRLVLTKGGIVRGRVVDAEGNPLQRINVRLDSPARILDEAGACVETREDGTWAYRFPPGEVRAFMTMRREGWGWQPEDRTVTLSVGQTISDVDFQHTCALPEDSPYRAKPVQARSDFVQANAAASDVGAPRTVQGVVTDTVGRPRQCVYVAPQGTRVWKGVMSDAYGRFTLEDVTPAQTTWIAYSQASRLFSIFTLPEAPSAKPIRVTLDLAVGDITGRVVGADGKAVADREIELIVTTADGLRFPMAHRAKTDSSGYYSSNLVPCGKGVTLETRLLNSDGTATAYRTGPIKLGVGQSFIEMPLLVAAEKKIQPDFDRNLRDDGMLHCRGRVVDEEGDPIPGVRIRLSFDVPNRMSMWVRSTVTDSQGCWHRPIPPQGMGIHIGVDHPEYYVEKSRIEPAREDLEKGTHRITMKRGRTLKGKVVDEQGRPIENALVCAKSSYSSTPGPYNQINEDSTTDRTRADGTFGIGGLAPGQRTITVYSDHHAPALAEVDIQGKATAVNVVLQRGRTYQARIVDANGVPIEGARVGINEWRLGQKQRRLTRLATTDGDGRCTLPNLPDGQIELSFHKKPYMAFQKDLPEDLSQVDESVLYEALVFTGNVVDAKTNEPVTKFRITNGIKWNRDSISFDWSRYYHDDVEDPNGAFSRRWSGYGISYPLRSVAGIKIEASGYLPGIAGPQELDRKCEPVTIRLRKGVPVTGTVVGPDGHSASQAQVAFRRPRPHGLHRRLPIL